MLNCTLESQAMPEEKLVVTVIGAGKIGLSLACQFPAHGTPVIDRGLILPLFDHLFDTEMQQVAETIGSVVSKHALAKL